MMKAPRKETTSGAEKILVNSETEKGIAGRKNKKKPVKGNIYHNIEGNSGIKKASKVAISEAADQPKGGFQYCTIRQQSS